MAVCSICDGTGWKIVERAGLSGAQRCECAAAARTVGLREGSQIPPNYQRASLENFKIPHDNAISRKGLGQVLMDVRGFVREFPLVDPPGLLLVGDPGTGKTHLAVAVLKALIEKGHEALFFDYQNLLGRIHAGYDRNAGTSDREAYATALEVEVLLIDDLGSHRVNEWVEDTVTSILTHRCNHKKPLIATTNLDVRDTLPDTRADMTGVRPRKTLSEVIGRRARSRLHEMCRILEMPSVEDYRVKRGR